MRRFCALAVLIGLFFPALCAAQGDAAVPFLTIPPSASGNGMAGIAGTVPGDDPTALLANPAQLGMSGLSTLLRVGFYPSSTSWMPGMPNGNMTYNVSAFSAGMNLNRFLSLPFDVGFSVAYSHIGIDYGTFVLTGESGPEPLGVFDATEHSNNWTFGLGFDYYVRLGFGFTTKSVESDLAPFDVQHQGREGIATVSAEDAGIIAEVPATDIVRRLTGDLPGLWNCVEPALSFSAAYARLNCGDDKVVYIDPAQGDPLPRTAMAGVSYSIGFDHRGTNDRLRLIGFTGAHQVEDLLVMRFPAPVDSFGYPVGEPPPWQYARGGGAIRFFDNVILGEGSTHATIRKGWELNFCEFFSLRGGTVLGRGVSYSTSGWGLRVGGLMKILERAVPDLQSASVYRFVADHFDARYDHASTTYDDPLNLNNGVTYNGLLFIVK